MLKHGQATRNEKTHEYGVWREMWRRCIDPSRRGYERYGGRGIKVCLRWRSFPHFFADMGICPDGYSIDRINPDGNYEPKNCRWASAETQNRNRRDNHNLTAEGRTQILMDWARELGVHESWIRRRLKKGVPFSLIVKLARIYVSQRDTSPSEAEGDVF